MNLIKIAQVFIPDYFFFLLFNFLLNFICIYIFDIDDISFFYFISSSLSSILGTVNYNSHVDNLHDFNRNGYFTSWSSSQSR